MLILSRKPGDAILIGGNIRIVVLANDGGGVRLGIDAPSSIAIVREEIVKDITDQNVRGAATPGDVSFLDGLDPGKKGDGKARRPDSKAANSADSPEDDEQEPAEFDAD